MCALGLHVLLVAVLELTPEDAGDLYQVSVQPSDDVIALAEEEVLLNASLSVPFVPVVVGSLRLTVDPQTTSTVLNSTTAKKKKNFL